MIAFTVLTIGFGAVMTSLVSTRALTATERERSLAVDAAASAIERLKGVDFDEVFSRFNSSGADDPEGDGSAPGEGFSVAGLTAPGDAAGGWVGTIEFPGGPLQIREDVEDEELGLPRDLNGDGDVDSFDHSEDYEVLPVRVRVTWIGPTGNQAIELVTVLTSR